MMEPIGGYFSLELPKHEEYHKDAIRLNTGRNCLEYILRCKKYNKVYIPYYTCDVVLEPFLKLDITYEFYHINIHLEISKDIRLKKGEALLYTNYFGLKQRYVEHLTEQYGQQLIVDNTQAFYDKPVNGIDTFYTCRKFFGVPDGAYLYTDKQLDIELEEDESYERCASLLKRIDLGPEAGYCDFREISKSLVGQSIKKMSKLTQRMMQGINYDAVAQQRRANYMLLQKTLGSSNCLNLPLEDDAVPMVYPFLTSLKDLRERLINNRIYIARYWPNVLDWNTKDDIEYLLSLQTQHLPIDQRYGIKDMKRIIEVINKRKIDMESKVSFRVFEERDIDFVYRCKNDEKLNSLIVGNWHPFTHEEAKKWVHGCMGEHDNFKFWAICSNDEEMRIVGWTSLSEINLVDKSACFHGIVIADPDYRDGFAWIETYLFVYSYAFEQLNLNYVYGSALTDHITSQTMRRVMYSKTIEKKENAVFRDGKYHDVSKGVLFKEDYINHKIQGDYEFKAILKRLRTIKKELKNQQ